MLDLSLEPARHIAMLYTFYRLGRLYIASPMLFMVAIVCASTVVVLSLAVPWLIKGVLDDGLAQRQMSVLYRVGALRIWHSISPTVCAISCTLRSSV